MPTKEPSGVRRLEVPESNFYHFKANRQRIYEVLRDGAVQERLAHGRVRVMLSARPPEEEVVLRNLEAAGCETIRIYSTPSGRRGYVGIRTEGCLMNLRVDAITHHRVRMLGINSGATAAEIVTRAVNLLWSQAQATRSVVRDDE
jgi:hypothetical protein